jgi:MinD-like ATPase involved in chromosome partitioning or flagellar assembly
MALICVSSAHGAPGATTLALLAAGCWPRPVVVVEADPAGGVLAVRYGLSRTPGLADLAAAVDTHAPAQALWSSAQTLPGGLRVVVAPESGEVTVGILDDVAGPLARWCLRLEDVDVIVDCGRTLPGSPSVALMGAADAVLVVARSTADQLYPSAHRVHALVAQTGCEHLGLVLVGGRPHRAEEVVTQLRVPVVGVVDDDPRTAQAFAAGGGAGRALRRSPLVRSAQGLVDDLAAALGVSAVAVEPAAHRKPSRQGRFRGEADTSAAAGRASR